MRDAVKWVTDALSSKNVVQQYMYFLVKDGMIHATDGRLTAAHPFPVDETFLVAGDEFTKVLNRLSVAEPVVSITDSGFVRLAHGRFRGDIQTIEHDGWTVPSPEAKWKKFPQGVLDGMRMLRPFVSDNAVHQWALCISIQNGQMFATNNATMGVVEVPGTKNIKAMVPSWAVDFLRHRDEDPTMWMATDNYLAFKWPNGAWMRTQLVTGEFPPMAQRLLAEAVTPEFKLTPEWIEGFQRVSALSEDAVFLYTDKMTGGKGLMACEEDIGTPVPDGTECTVWHPRFLDAVVAVATYWQPDAWPKAASFVGSSIRGLIMGRSK